MGDRNRVTHSLVRALRRVPAFASLGEPQLLRIFGSSANLAWNAGSMVFEKGTEGDALYIVLSGEVLIYDVEDGQELEIRRVGPGGFFGELSLFLNETHSKSVRATTDTELMVIPKASFERLLSSDRELDEYFHRLFEERAAEFKAQIRKTG